MNTLALPGLFPLVAFGGIAAMVMAMSRMLPWILRIVIGITVTVVLLTAVQQALAPTADDTKAAAVPLPWADTTTWTEWDDNPKPCPDRFRPDAVSLELAARADVLAPLRGQQANQFGTLAIVRGENALGQCMDFVATQTETNTGPPVRVALTPTELGVQALDIPKTVDWKILHAEQKAVFAAIHHGFRPIAVAASRPFCDPSTRSGATRDATCDAWLAGTRATVTGPRTAVWRW